MNWEELLDPRHEVKSIVRVIENSDPDKILPKSVQTSIIHMFHIVIAMDSGEKAAMWRNIAEHYKGNHTNCLHSEDASYEVLNPTQLTVVNRIINATLADVCKCKSGIHTNNNESLNSIKGMYCPKNRWQGASFEARCALAVLAFNQVDCFQVLCDEVIGHRINFHSMQILSRIEDARRQQREYKSKNQSIHPKAPHINTASKFGHRGVDGKLVRTEFECSYATDDSDSEIPLLSDDSIQNQLSSEYDSSDILFQNTIAGDVPMISSMDVDPDNLFPMVGLERFGFTCYFVSAVQILAHVMNSYAYKFKPDTLADEIFTVIQSMSNTFSNAIDIHQLFASFNKAFPQYAADEPNDCVSCLITLINEMITNECPSPRMLSMEIGVKLCDGTNESTILYSSIETYKIFTIGSMIRDSVRSAIHERQQKALISNESDKFSIVFSKHLLVVTERNFQANVFPYGEAISRRRIDLNEVFTVSYGEVSARYKVSGLIERRGTGVGHFISYIRSGATDNWIEFNDDAVTVKVKKLVSLTSVLILLTRLDAI